MYNLFARAQLRNTVESFVRRLADYLAGATRPREQSERLAAAFLDRFTRVPSFTHDLEPTLFLPVNEHSIALDFLLMNEFFELCLRLALSGGGETGKHHGRLFEDHARTIITGALKLQKEAIPIQANTKIRTPERDYGDVDFAFIHDAVLINLDMKSWGRTPEDFRGEYLAIRDRVAGLRKAMTLKVEPRGNELLRRLRKSNPGLRGVLNFLCLGTVEYVPWRCNILRYADQSRALTPTEIIELIGDADRFAAVVKSADIK